MIRYKHQTWAAVTLQLDDCCCVVSSSSNDSNLPLIYHCLSCPQFATDQGINASHEHLIRKLLQCSDFTLEFVYGRFQG